jgi:multidrug resistance efflux pump
MKKLYTLLSLIVFFYACETKLEKTKPTVESISESIYASGIVKSKNQYQVFATVNGIVEEVFVTEGDTLKKGMPIVLIANETQRLNKENALLASNFSNYNTNKGKLKDAINLIELAKHKVKNDSLLFIRQKNLWQQNIGTQVELEQRELAYLNAKTSYLSSIEKYEELNRQLNFNASQSKNNALISNKLETDFTVRSEIDGMIYNLSKTKGDIVGLQTPIAVVGDAKQFVLEMQVDEYDIIKIKKGLPVLITLDSYKKEVFNALVTKINPLMNERSKTFLVEAEFVTQPNILYPNITFEASIIINTKEKAILIPRNYLLNDSMVMRPNGEKIFIKTGLKDYQKIEVLSGLKETDEISKPE